MVFGRKSAFWGPESTQKPYIDYPTQYGAILKKVEKIVFLTPKIMIKFFWKSIFWPMKSGHQINITQLGKQGGGSTSDPYFFRLFFWKLGFLKNYEVLEGHKTILRYFRDFLTKF